MTDQKKDEGPKDNEMTIEEAESLVMAGELGMLNPIDRPKYAMAVLALKNRQAEDEAREKKK